MIKIRGMSDSYHPQDDQRPIDELIATALSGPDDEVYWDAIHALQYRGSRDPEAREVLDLAIGLCRSDCVVERVPGANILGQLFLPNHSHPEECLQTLLESLDVETEDAAIHAMIVALSQLGEPATIKPAARFRHHTDRDIHHAVVLAMSGHEDPAALEVLIELSGDPEPHVRDWACFSLGTMVEIDTPGLRDALALRLEDPDDDT
jgi:hypothetical protein